MYIDRSEIQYKYLDKIYVKLNIIAKIDGSGFDRPFNVKYRGDYLYREDSHKVYYISCVVNSEPFKNFRHIPFYPVIAVGEYDIFLKGYESLLIFVVSLLTYFVVINVVHYVRYFALLCAITSLFGNFMSIYKKIRGYHVFLIFFYLPIRLKLSMYSHFNRVLFPGKVGYIRYLRRNFRYSWVIPNRRGFKILFGRFLLGLLKSLKDDYITFRGIYLLKSISAVKISICMYFNFGDGVSYVYGKNKY